MRWPHWAQASGSLSDACLHCRWPEEHTVSSGCQHLLQRPHHLHEALGGASFLISEQLQSLRHGPKPPRRVREHSQDAVGAAVGTSISQKLVLRMESQNAFSLILIQQQQMSQHSQPLRPFFISSVRKKRVKTVYKVYTFTKAGVISHGNKKRGRYKKVWMKKYKSHFPIVQNLRVKRERHRSKQQTDSKRKKKVCKRLRTI